ncbi:conserved hypothetical protein [Candidatus Karelsulcia muelleri CARI]|uniref:Outer membrane protein assembly factor BamD n=1 Tax=Karelsulcia muelleri (strain CARI) TaxID=706194 RepID=E0TJL4_KARMC|nr:conserved hypothetical protein [Candidatus Karelsulcia muelleri CARI]
MNMLDYLYLKVAKIWKKNFFWNLKKLIYLININILIIFIYEKSFIIHNNKIINLIQIFDKTQIKNKRFKNNIKRALNFFYKDKYEETLKVLKDVLSENKNFLIKEKKLYQNILFFIGLCNNFLLNFDTAILYFKYVFSKFDPNFLSEESLFYIGMCYSFKYNDFNFDQEDTYKLIYFLLTFKELYPNSRRIKKVDYNLYKALFKIKQKKLTIAYYYFNNKNYKSSLIIFKYLIKYFISMPDYQIFYIYMIISQYKIEENNKNYSFKETRKLYDNYLSLFKKVNFKIEKKLNISNKILFLFNKIESYLIIVDIYSKLYLND